MKLNKHIRGMAVALAAVALAACSDLSKEAKEIVGTYYNPELSLNEPVMELRKNGSCTVTAIKPGVLTYSVDGKWNVLHDSLTMTLDASTLRAEGDTTLIGRIPDKWSRRVVSHTDFALQLERDGVTYSFQRRNE